MRYQGSSLFSGQDIINISMEPEFADLVGFTQSEVESNFAPYIERAAALLELSRGAFLEKLRRYYGGFCFDSDTAVTLYCPWSINNFFQQIVHASARKPKFANFWMQSANASAALRPFLRAHKADLKFVARALEGKLSVSTEDFNNPTTFDQLSLPSIMMQSGYLTLKRNGEEADQSKYACGFTNLEIAKPFADVALELALSAQMEQGQFVQVKDELVRAVLALDMATMANALNSLLVCLCYDAGAASRAVVQLALLACRFTSDVSGESHGRSDIELEYGNKLLVIELKHLSKAESVSKEACLALAQEAQDQIFERSYGKSLATLQHTPYKERNAVVLVIAETERQIAYWRLLSLDQAEHKTEPQRGDGWVVPLKREESAENNAATSGEAGKNAERSTEARNGDSISQDQVKLNAIFVFAHVLAANSDNVVTLDPSLVTAGIITLFSKPNIQYSQEQIKVRIASFLEQAQQITTPQVETFDRVYLEQSLVDLLSK